jgi:5-methylcytosine-specific restriction endonuclease McrA
MREIGLSFIDSLVTHIMNDAKSLEDVEFALQSLHSSMKNIDWKARLEKKANEEIAYQNEIVPCQRCGSCIPRKELMHINRPKPIMQGVPVYESIGDFCAECAETILATIYPTCLICNQKYPRDHKENEYFCPKCISYKLIGEARKVHNHNSRTRSLQLQSDLTVKQWLFALDHFKEKCAYCQQRKYTVLEHFIPVEVWDGGTTAGNCLPACQRCNGSKSDLHPDDFATLFPSENIVRIKAYFASVPQESAEDAKSAAL